MSEVHDPFIGLNWIGFVGQGRSGTTNGDVCHSLNKKGRWKYMNVLRNEITELQTETKHGGVQVSAMEQYERADKPLTNQYSLWRNHQPRSNLARAYHAVDDQGNEIHRFAKNTVAQVRYYCQTI